MVASCLKQDRSTIGEFYCIGEIMKDNLRDASRVARYVQWAAEKALALGNISPENGGQAALKQALSMPLLAHGAEHGLTQRRPRVLDGRHVPNRFRVAGGANIGHRD